MSSLYVQARQSSLNEVSIKTQKWQLQNVKNRFSELVNKAAGGEPQLVTKNGKPVIYVIDVDTYNRKIGFSSTSKKKVLLARPHKDIELEILCDTDDGREIGL